MAQPRPLSRGDAARFDRAAVVAPRSSRTSRHPVRRTDRSLVYARNFVRSVFEVDGFAILARPDRSGRRSLHDHRPRVLHGGHESHFISLYLLVIIVASILFSRKGTFLTAGFAFVLLGGMVELTFYNRLPRTAGAMPTAHALQTWVFSNLFAFLAVAYLSNVLAEKLRRKGAELEQKSGELQDLQAFNEDIIHSMRGGLLTTDAQGIIVLLNRTGEEITGYKFADVRGKSLHELWPGFWRENQHDTERARLPRHEIDFKTQDGKQRFLGISVSPLRTRSNKMGGYRF